MTNLLKQIVGLQAGKEGSGTRRHLMGWVRDSPKTEGEWLSTHAGKLRAVLMECGH